MVGVAVGSGVGVMVGVAVGVGVGVWVGVGVAVGVAVAVAVGVDVSVAVGVCVAKASERLGTVTGKRSNRIANGAIQNSHLKRLITCPSASAASKPRQSLSPGRLMVEGHSTGKMQLPQHHPQAPGFRR